ncbi:MAG: hypothetical protein HZB76_02370 [Chlamydiae bacterium]|nr:hypothetical protein [Chlamydiota bacterium]
MLKMNRFLILFLFFSAGLFAQDLELDGKQIDPDIRALRQWINEKRMITIKEMGGNLALSGEVRPSCQGNFETKNGKRQIGRESSGDTAQYQFDIELNLMLDYHTDRSWADVKLEFDNEMGTQSGKFSNIVLERAYFGGRAIQGETFTLDAELGRRELNLFDSKIEFGSILDGAIFKFNKAFQSIGDFYFNTAVFLVDDFYKHFGEVGEFGFLRIANTGFLIKYSFINWKKHFSGSCQELRNDRFRFGISQVLLAYQVDLNNRPYIVKPYIAFLCNHFAKELPVVANKKANLAGYIGISVGTISKAKDWAFDASYQIVQAQAVPDFDAAGVGRGNAEGIGTYTIHINGKGGATTVETTVGGGNFLGFEIEGLYAITQNLIVLMNYQESNTLDHQIGPNIHFTGFEIEFIYAF